jgi:dienelactone hydrolase
MFDYDRALPLDVRNENPPDTTEPGVSVHHISYASPGHSRVNADWVVPNGPGPFAGVIFVHAAPGDRTSFADEAHLLAHRGLASLLVEAPWAQTEAWGKQMGEPGHDRDEHTRTVVDLRRSIDLVASRPQADADRLGYVGHSFGAMFGGILAGFDKRLKTLVLLSGVGSFTDVAVANIPTLGGQALEEYRRGLAPIDPARFIGEATPAPLLFQLADNDAFPPMALTAYAEAASEPKRIAWYHADHYSVNEAGRADRIEWLTRSL